jgi:hypothetical protein
VQKGGGLRSQREGAQIEAGELVWGGVKSGVIEELDGAVEGHGDVIEGGEGGGRNSTPTSTAAADGYARSSTNTRTAYARKNGGVRQRIVNAEGLQNNFRAESRAEHNRDQILSWNGGGTASSAATSKANMRA